MLLDNLRKIGIDLDLKPGLWSTNWDKAKKIETAPNIISMAWWPTISSPSDWFFSLYSTQENQFSIYLIIVIMFWIHLQKKHGNLKRLIKICKKNI